MGASAFAFKEGLHWIQRHFNARQDHLLKGGCNGGGV